MPTFTNDGWLAVGRSDAPDARTAGTEAARDALTRGNPALLIVFCSRRYDLQAQLHAIDAQSGGAPH